MMTGSAFWLMICRRACLDRYHGSCYLNADFAELYINKLKKSDVFESSDYELSEADISCELYDEIIDDEVIPMGKTASHLWPAIDWVKLVRADTAVQTN